MTKENNILTEEGYFAEYNSLLTKDKFQYQIWMKLESRLLEKYGINRFKNIGAFRMAKQRYENKLKKK